MKNLIYIIIICFLTGCYTLKKTAKKSIIQKDSISVNIIEKDSIVYNTKTVITPASSTDLILKDVCDSLGNIKVAELQAQLGKTNIKLITKNNTIFLKANTDSIVEVYKDKYESKFKRDSTAVANFYKEKQSEKIVKTRTPWWSYIVTIALILIVIIALVNLRKLKGFLKI